MVIRYQPSRAASLASQGLENNPFALWNNIATTYAVAAGTEDGGPVTNLLTDATAKYCYPTVDGSGDAIITFSVASPITCVAINSHNLGTLGLDVAVEYYTGSAWADCGSGSVTAADDTAIAWRFGPNSATSWRIVISDATGVQPVLANLWAGSELIFPRRFYQGYTSPIRPNIVQTVTNISDGGHYIGSSVVRQGSAPSAASFTNIAPAFVRGSAFAAFADHFNAGGPLFFAWRPTKYGDLFFGWRSGDAVSPTNSGPSDLMSFALAMRYHHEP